jgi:hypothetical protein
MSREISQKSIASSAINLDTDQLKELERLIASLKSDIILPREKHSATEELRKRADTEEKVPA